MARYIDADALESELFRDGIAGIFLNYPRRIKFTIGDIRGMLKNERIAPTEDVVPRSEVEYLQQKISAYERVCGKLSFDGNHALIVLSETTEYIPKNIADKFKDIAVHKAKQEVAKDILGKLSSHTSIGIRHLKELMADCDNEENKIWLDGKISELCNIEKIISELKKKNIGE